MRGGEVKGKGWEGGGYKVRNGRWREGWGGGGEVGRGEEVRGRGRGGDQVKEGGW